MYAHALWALAAGVSLSAFAPAPLPRPDSAKADLKKLQGAWEVALHQTGSRKMPGRDQMRAVFAGDKLTFYRGETKTTEYTITLDAKAKPKSLDLKRPSI